MTEGPESPLSLPNDGLYQDEHRARYKRLLESAEDDKTGFAGAVIGGAFVEFYLRRTIARFLGDTADRFLKNEDGEDRHYDVKDMLKLAYALGALEEDRYKMFKAFAVLRNAFAHDPDEYIGSKKCKRLLLKVLTAWVPTGPYPSGVRKRSLQYYADSANMEDGVSGTLPLNDLIAVIVDIARYAQEIHAAAKALVTPALVSAASQEAAEAGRDFRAQQ